MADFLSDVGDALAAVAPSIASAFGGPLAGLGVTWLEKALGIDPGAGKSDAGGLQAALKGALANPDQVLALKKADNEFRQFCLDNDLSYAKLEVQDRDSARQRETATRDWMPKVLAFGVVAIAATATIMLFTDNIPTARDPIMATTVGTVLGYIFNELKQVLGYYFGSSAGSANKDRAIMALTAQSPPK